MAIVQLPEALAEERSAVILEQTWPASRRIRWQLFRGEDVPVVSANEDAQASLLTKLGFEIVRTGSTAEEGRKIRLVNPEHQPTPEQFESVKKEKALSKPSARKGEPHRLDCPEGCGRYTSADSLRKHIARKHRESQAVAVSPKDVPVLRPEQQTLPMGPPAGQPWLGMDLSVFLLHLDDEGEVSVGLRSSDGSQFMAKLVGAVA